MHIKERQKIAEVVLIVLLVLVLALIVYMVVSMKKNGSQNTRTLTALHQYMNAIELARVEDIYPGKNSFACLGDYTDNLCWDKEGTGISEDATLNETLRKFLPLLPPGTIVEDVTDSALSREGYIYRTRQAGTGYEIQYVLKGRNQDCGFGEEVKVQVMKETQTLNTLCTIIH